MRSSLVSQRMGASMGRGRLRPSLPGAAAPLLRCSRGGVYLAALSDDRVKSGGDA
jgi:hypothetical protein